ncbi:chemotaxis protein [Paramagnetospirillum marisnigri]|uniref:Chemotaxis protein n=1 Tax=Paramagnetospirillum marisnigri TaxID=1285242 RepID=A0A178MKN4_9PROT|nr:methyl-accepting chemotaxis protein [Paramagnetospirillum marisnigri]OAN49159.1 chemotaxis protein [Paramagnetospirillum marisnigri]
MSAPSLRRTVAASTTMTLIALLATGLVAYAAIGYGLMMDASVTAALADAAKGGDGWRASLEAAVASHRGFGWTMVVLAVVAGGALFFLALRSNAQIRAIIALVERGEAVAAQAAQGDFNARVLRIGRTDELGRMMTGFNRVLDLTEEFAKDAGAAMKMAGQKQYFRYIPLQGLRGDYLGYAEGINKVLADMDARDQETRRFEQSVQAMVADVSKATNAIGQTAGIMAARSESAGGSSLTVGEAAEVTTQRAASVSESIHQLAGAINEIAQQVTRSATVAQNAVADIGTTVERMNGLADSVSQIGEVVSLINDIASQTNLLALNATIEAARAGEAGKGFAVVANEVKTLASQTARATEDITNQVNAVQEAARSAASGIGDVVETIRSIDRISATIAGAVQEQEAVTREISEHIDEVAAQAADVSENVAHLSQASAQACGGTVRVIWSARMLGKVVESLTSQVNEYVSKVK